MYFSPTVKPTVIDVDIYVNSIGPVSSINMVRSTCVYLMAPLHLHAYSLHWILVAVLSSRFKAHY